MSYSMPGSSVHVITQAGIVEWVAISYSRDSSHPGIELTSPASAGGFFTSEPSRYLWSFQMHFPFFSLQM